MVRTPRAESAQCCNSGKADRLLVSTKDSRALDEKAQHDWGFSNFTLVEIAGRLCAQRLTGAFPGIIHREARVTVAAGTGNNAADALVMLRYWILAGLVNPSASAVVVTRMAGSENREPRAELLKYFRKMHVTVLVWDGDIGEAVGQAADDRLAQSDVIIDGIAGTGLDGALHGKALKMVNAVNSHKRPLVISVDIPSGNSDYWEPGMPIVKADITLAIEPRKLCLYTPAARPYAGTILSVSGVFPREAIAGYSGAELLDWKSAQKRISKIRPEAYKHKRGTVEIRAGSPGATGAALLAARGAQVSGAGLIRLVADDDIYPILASQVSGIMVFPAGNNADFNADAVLLGPGWGKTENRLKILDQALELEKKGVPLILDADAVELARGKVFQGHVILTPHPGELSSFSGFAKEELLCRPGPILLKLARERKAVIVFKGHVITIAAPDGRLGVVDGMAPALATGGSGDLLAGFCAAIAARMVQRGFYCGYTCAAIAATLLIASGSSENFSPRFTDPLELADRAADLAGEAWLKADIPGSAKGLFP